MKTIDASEFDTHCRTLMDEVERTGEPIVITKNGRPVTRLVAAHPDRPATIVGAMKGQIPILGDIVSPLDSS